MQLSYDALEWTSDMPRPAPDVSCEDCWAWTNGTNRPDLTNSGLMPAPVSVCARQQKRERSLTDD